MDDFFTYDNLVGLLPVLSAIVTTVISYLRQDKSQSLHALDEQYIHFIAPIYHLLTTSYSDTQLTTCIDRICNSNPHLIPDGFIKSFTFFKLSYQKYTPIGSTDFYKEISALYKYLRYNLHYSKRKPSRSENKSAQKQLGKQPSFFGSFLILLRTSVAIIVFAFPVIVAYQLNYLPTTIYYILMITITIGTSIYEIKALNRYYNNKS